MKFCNNSFISFRFIIFFIFFFVHFGKEKNKAKIPNPTVCVSIARDRVLCSCYCEVPSPWFPYPGTMTTTFFLVRNYPRGINFIYILYIFVLCVYVCERDLSLPKKKKKKKQELPLFVPNKRTGEKPGFKQDKKKILKTRDFGDG